MRSVVTSRPVQAKVWSVSAAVAGERQLVVRVAGRAQELAVGHEGAERLVGADTGEVGVDAEEAVHPGAHAAGGLEPGLVVPATVSLDSTARSDTGAPAVIRATLTTMGGSVLLSTRCSTPSAGRSWAVTVKPAGIGMSAAQAGPGTAERQRDDAERRCEGGEPAMSVPWGAHHFEDSARTGPIPTPNSSEQGQLVAMKRFARSTVIQPSHGVTAVIARWNFRYHAS